VHAQEAAAKSYPVLSGVGLALRAEEGGIWVAKVLPNSPAAASRLIEEGARLLAVEVDGKETSLDGKTVGEAASLIRGPVGTGLVLTVVPPSDGAAIKAPLTRAPLEIAGATYERFIGKPMPDLKLRTLDGTPAGRLGDYHGKLVVLDFWASWCPTCYPPVARMQTIAADHPEWKGKVEFIAVTVDADLSQAADVIEKQKWKSTLHRAVNLDELNAAGVSVVPLVIIIASDRTIATMAGAHALDIEKEVAALLSP
jgi:thiol-disulfide isomerase/thioredoxin